MPSARLIKEMNDAANRLHHLSMRYVGAYIEVATGKPVGLLPQMPGLRELRDLIDLTLFLRAKINAVTKVMITSGTISEDALIQEMIEQYNWLTQEKCKFLDVDVDDNGLIIRTGKNDQRL